MAIINTNGAIPFSKHRNSKSKSLDLRDLSGKPIRGSQEAHFKSVQSKIQDRYDLKQEAFKLLSIDELKALVTNPTKPQICSSTDKSALADVYFEKKYEIYDAQEIQELKEINKENLDDVEKLALERCIQLKELKEKVKNKQNENEVQNSNNAVLSEPSDISSSSEVTSSSEQAVNS